MEEQSTMADDPLTRLLQCETSVDNIVHHIARTVEESADGEIEASLWKVWRSVVSHAKRTPHSSQGKLVELVQALQGLPEPQRDGQPITVLGQRLWRDLPVLGATMREEWNRAPYVGGQNAMSESDWTSVNAFAARLTASGPSESALDFSLYAIWTLRETLENNHTNGLQNNFVEDWVPAVAVWFIYAASTTSQMCAEQRTFGGKLAKPGDLYSDKEWRGFSWERWAVWRARILELTAQIRLKTTGQLINEALVKQIDAEREWRSERT